MVRYSKIHIKKKPKKASYGPVLWLLFIVLAIGVGFQSGHMYSSAKIVQDESKYVVLQSQNEALESELQKMRAQAQTASKLYTTMQERYKTAMASDNKTADCDIFDLSRR